jgi:lipopolysaccharide transport system ATP-binding protein
VPEIVIRAEGLSKLYYIGERNSYDRLSQVLTATASRWLRHAKEKAAPALVPMWALDDLSFDIRRGQVVGVVGQNGAGKSTLLKILSRITEPTRGCAEIHGRVGSLLEVGTGFQPDLTGRETVFLNGALLGMSRKDIRRNLASIIDFSGIEPYIDTPVKFYSSGMHARLAFSVATHLAADILIVDEVLAVGDAAFQAKCISKMGEVTRSGRTVLFVTHNIGMIGRMCDSAMFLEKGKLRYFGDTSVAISQYLSTMFAREPVMTWPEQHAKRLQLRRLAVRPVNGMATATIDRQSDLIFELDIDVRDDEPGSYIALMLDSVDGTPVWHSQDLDQTDRSSVVRRAPGAYRFAVRFPGGLLNAGTYNLRAGIANSSALVHDTSDGLIFDLVDTGTHAAVGAHGQQRRGVLTILLEWKQECLDATLAS